MRRRASNSDYVYIIMEEGLMPFGVDFDGGADLEEERQLCYVAMTRARKGPRTHCRRLAHAGQTHNNRRLSRFLDEAGSDRLERLNDEPIQRKRSMSAPAYASSFATCQPARVENLGIDLLTAPVDARQAADGGALRIGTRVRYAKFGPGVVMFTSRTRDKLKVRICFAYGADRHADGERGAAGNTGRKKTADAGRVSQ